MVAPGATPTTPVPVPRLAISDAMPVPWPLSLVSTRPSVPLPLRSSPGTTAPARSGTEASTPLSTTATVTPDPSVICHTCDICHAVCHHWPSCATAGCAGATTTPAPVTAASA